MQQRLLINTAEVKLENIDNDFISKADNDYNVTVQSLNTTVAEVTTRHIEESDMLYSGMHTKVDIPEAYRVDAKPFIERPFYLTTTPFTTSDALYTILNCRIKQLPGDVVRSNTSIQQMFKMAALGRPDLVLNISMAGTLAHAGCILAGVLPPMPFVSSSANPFTAGAKDQLINTILSGPHAFLHANEASSVNIRVPWYCNFDMMSLDMEKGVSDTVGPPATTGYYPAPDLNYVAGNYGTLVLLVLNKLAVSTGGTSTVNIVIEACFKNFDMVVPTPRFLEWTPQAGKASRTPRSFLQSAKDFGTGLFDYTANGLKTVASDGLDAIRGWIRGLTGLHNPNVPLIDTRIINTDLNFLNNTSTHQYFEKLDMIPTHSRIVKEPLFGNDLDEMSVSYITGKKQYVGTFEVKTTDGVGALKWARPISPRSGGKSVQFGTTPNIVTLRQHSNNLDLMYHITRAWRGGLKVYIQSVMNNKQQVKLKVIKYYNPSSKILSAVPNYQTIVSAPSHLLEFTQGGQMHEVSLPYLCRNEILPCADDLNADALYHGMYYIYVAQPLVVSDNSPSNVFFNVYIEGDKDLAFYGQNNRNLLNTNWDLFTLPSAGRDAGGGEPSWQPESGDTMVVMNEPQKQDNKITRDDKLAMSQYHNRLIPYPDIRPIIRRMYLQYDKEALFTEESLFVRLDLASILGERCRLETTPIDGAFPQIYNITPLNLAARMYYSKSAGFKVRVEFKIVEPEEEGFTKEEKNLDIVAFFMPPLPWYAYKNQQPFFQSTTARAPNFTGYLPPHIVTSNVVTGTGSRVLEFEVPFTSIFKFVGGPDKFRDYAEGAQTTGAQSAAGDIGTIQIAVRKLAEGQKLLTRLRVYVGVNDETRFGHHCIAPVYIVNPSSSYYSTVDADGEDTTPSNTLSNSVYIGGFA